VSQYYDIFGDIHGHANALEALLIKLDYKLVNGVYQHEKHKVIFLGDFIDRGPHQKKVIEIVRPMIEQGFAMSVMGNHEFNAICYASTGSDGNPLREHSVKNFEQHEAFLDAYPDKEERHEIISWFKTLPVFIETDGIRIVHACWNNPALTELASYLDERNSIKDDAYELSSQKGSVPFEAIEVLLKGPEVGLPEGVSFKDKDNTNRMSARIKWWSGKQDEIKKRLHLGKELTQADKLDQVIIDDSYHYAEEHNPVFVGHYWLNDAVPSPLSDNCACLDYSVARKGKLVAYKWRGERLLQDSNFIWC